MPTSLDQLAGSGGAAPRTGGLQGRAYAFVIAFISAVGGFLFGYDLAIVGGANTLLKDQFDLHGWWYGFTTSSATLGCILGPLFGARICDRLGRRKTLLAACLLLAVGSILTAVPNDMITFNVFRIVGGIGVGLCSIASPIYVNEIAPARWRGGLGLMYQLAIVVGSILAAWAAYLLYQWLPKETSWRWMFASELAFVLVFIVLLLLVPESPRWLAERGRLAEARAIFARIDGAFFADSELAEIQQSLAAESGTWRELLGPGLRMALLVGLCLAFFNNATGWTAMNTYLAQVLRKAGFEESEAIFGFLQAYGFMGVMTLAACFLVDRAGRRPLWLASSLLMVAANVLMGLVFHWQVAGGWVLAAVFLCAIPHSFALGSLPWLMMSEIFPTRIRARATAITTTFIWTVGFLAQFTFPVLAEFSEGILGSIAGVFWLTAAICVLSFFFGLWLLPETKGRTLEQIAESWQKGRRTRSPPSGRGLG